MWHHIGFMIAAEITWMTNGGGPLVVVLRCMLLMA